MNTYRYRAARADGTIVKGRIDAADPSAAASWVSESGLFPISMHAARRPLLSRRAGGARELGVLFRSVAALVSAGVPVERALAASEGITSRALAASVGRVRERVRRGDSLSAALSADGAVPGSVLGVIAAGERASQLGSALAEVAEQLEGDAELAGRIRGALAYPALLLTVGVTSMMVMGYVVIPRFAAILSDMGAELPLATRILLGGSALLARFGWLAGLAIAAAVMGLAEWYRTSAGRLRAHTELLRVPLVGTIRLTLATARTCRALAAMVGTGMPLLAALDACPQAAGDAAVALRLGLVRDRVAQGERLAPSLEAERAVTGAALQLVAVGETSGQLALMLRRAGDLAATEAERTLRTLVNLLEPALVVALGGMVAFMAAALLQAVYSLRPGTVM